MPPMHIRQDNYQLPENKIIIKEIQNYWLRLWNSQFAAQNQKQQVVILSDSPENVFKAHPALSRPAIATWIVEERRTIFLQRGNWIFLKHRSFSALSSFGSSRQPSKDTRRTSKFQQARISSTAQQKQLWSSAPRILSLSWVAGGCERQ